MDSRLEVKEKLLKITEVSEESCFFIGGIDQDFTKSPQGNESYFF